MPEPFVVTGCAGGRANAQVNRELKLIPRGDFNQSKLRMLYQMIRSNALGANAEEALPARQVLEQATAMIRQQAPAFEPRYDAQLFDP
jgi:hypothetical protein